MKNRWSGIRRFLLRLLLWFFGSTIGVVLLFKFVPVPITPLMVIRIGEQVIAGKPVTLKKDWTSLQKMGRLLPMAVIASEDQKFEEHFGFDFEAIQKARKYNERHKGRTVKGASTISQQTAKNVFLWPSRSWVRKGFEVYFTFLIELLWSKERIMEVYLNVIETGDGIYGGQAAAANYFHKPAVRLSTREAALIAAILPNPRKWSAVRPSAYVQRKAARIIYYMNRNPFGLEW